MAVDDAVVVGPAVVVLLLPLLVVVLPLPLLLLFVVLLVEGAVALPLAAFPGLDGAFSGCSKCG